MITSLIMNAVNLGGNAVLIYGCHRGIEGVAIPTLVSRCVAAAIILVLLNNQSRQIHIFHPFSFHTDWNLLKKILYIGIPNGLENSMFQLGKILVLSLVTSFGTLRLQQMRYLIILQCLRYCLECQLDLQCSRYRRSVLEREILNR